MIQFINSQYIFVFFKFLIVILSNSKNIFRYKLIKFYVIINIIYATKNSNQMGIGDWGLGIGDWGLGPIPNPQSPIPNPQSPIPIIILLFKKIFNEFLKII